MNRLIGNQYIAVEGKDNALKMASALIDQNYQVFIQLDDANVYIVGYTENDIEVGCQEFALLSDVEAESIEEARQYETDKAAIERVKGLIEWGDLSIDDLVPNEN